MKNNTPETKKAIFRFMLILTVVAAVAAVALIVFAFIAIGELGLWSCLIVGVLMLVIVTLVALTIRQGLGAYGK